MPLKLRITKRKGKRRGFRAWLSTRFAKMLVAGLIVVCVALLGVFAFYYHKYEQIVDRRMRGPIFNNASKIYALPKVVRVGQALDAGDIANELRRAGYTEAGEKGESRLGTYRLLRDGIEVKPGTESYHSSEGGIIRISGGVVRSIAPLGEARAGNPVAFELEPQLVTALFDSEQRAKRRLVSYDEIPQVMIDAVLAIEDRRFFEHSGVNYLRLMKSAWIDLMEGHRQQGGSTLTMQISRGFFLTPEKTIKRKLTEMLIAFQLEQRFSKKQIFELYANHVYMGQRGSFTINGFAEASRAYFDKDLKNLNVPEAALLAAIIQRPSYLDPYRHAERALARRNLVIEGMVETEKLTREEADRAKATPLKLAPPNVEASDAPYFVDLVRTNLLASYSEQELNEQAYRIYTTIDPDLQRAAAEAVEAGMKSVDEQLRKYRTRRTKVGTGKNARTVEVIRPGPEAQVALVAMDPRTGEVLALVGGRDYGFSQLNHAVAKRPTGSIFKPFVYAAAVGTALEDGASIFTPASLVDDSPTTFIHGDEIYEPRNYKEEYHGPVTARFALAKSLNNATVKVAEQVGYERVAELARAAGIKSVQATPSMALGAYEATPLDMASAYTVFANSGARVPPMLVRSVRDAKGEVIEETKNTAAPVMDPRVAYVMTSMMEAVVNSGTGATVRARGFTAPAAGKTGTSHDGWFAGYTSNLICIVWIGFDDYTDLRLSGSSTAAPIWADFMKKAVTLSRYKDVKPFAQPPGVVDVRLDRVTNRLATPTCPETYSAAFIAGTEPHDTCDSRGFFQTILGLDAKPLPPVAVSNTDKQTAEVRPGETAEKQNEPEKKKKGFFGRIFGIFKDDKDEKEQAAPAPAPAPAPPPAPANGASRPQTGSEHPPGPR